MLSRRWQMWFVPTRQSLIVGLALVGYLPHALMLPLPVGPSKDRSRPYPCQDRRCGCRSAEECWRSCCCFSPADKRAWAEKHGVEAPVLAPMSAPGGWNKPRQCESALAVANPPASPCSCCQPRGEPDPPPPSAPEPSITWWVAVEAQHCQGESDASPQTRPSLPPPSRVTWLLDLAPHGPVQTHSLLAYTSTHRPPVPPPRNWN